MKLHIETKEIITLTCDLLGLSCFEDELGNLEIFRVLDHELDGFLSSLAKEEDFKGKDGETLLIHTFNRLPSKRILLIGLGKRSDFDIPNIRRYGAKLVQLAKKYGVKELAAVLPSIASAAQQRGFQFLAEGLLLGNYRFEQLKSEENQTKDKLEKVQLLTFPKTDQKNPSSICIAKAEVITKSICIARNLVNEPSCRMTPLKLTEFAIGLAKDSGLEHKVLDSKDCEKKGMNLFLAVAKGSLQEPSFIHLIYKPKSKSSSKNHRLVLVGKGITFDSGGLSLKNSKNMADMKSDMAGAASVLGVMSALPALGIQSEVHAIIAATENMPSGSACKVGDVYTGLSGKSVEIINTDAEGRLTLADALAYAVQLSPDEIIDIATLTGSCVVALGPHMAGVMGNDRSFIERFIAASRSAGEDVWHLPLPLRLKEQLKSDIADLKNLGERWGGALTAGLFLQEFVNKIPWIHIDIAGPSFADKPYDHIPKGGTGYGVATILEYISSRDDIS